MSDDYEATPDPVVPQVWNFGFKITWKVYAFVAYSWCAMGYTTFELVKAVILSGI